MAASRIIRFAALLPAASLVAGCLATVPPEEDPVLIKLTELEDRMVRVERVVNNDSLLDLNQQVAQMRREINELRGLVETSQFNVDGVVSRNREQYLDLDGRIQALEKNGVIRGGGSADAALGDDPREAYQYAFELLQERRYEEAQTAFKDFLRRYPDNTLADNAYYWLGETSYVKGDFEGALGQFQSVIERFPQSSKRSDALLKIGFAQYELGQFPDARSTLEQVVSEFPDKTASRLATQRLQQMTADGR